MKQTAVEYLEHIYLTTGIDRNVHFNQAKEMEKKHQREVWDEAIDEDSIYTTFEQYYNETFKSE